MDKVELLFEDFSLLENGEVKFIPMTIDFKEDRSVISESIQNQNGMLELTLPVGYVNKETANKRSYKRAVVESALSKIAEPMKNGFVHGTHGKHPSTFFVDPDHVSHLIIEAFIDDKDVIWNKWLCLPNLRGTDLTNSFLGGARYGVSIRGRGVVENGDVSVYEYGGTDTVGLPSTGIYTGIGYKATARLVGNKSISELLKVDESRIVESIMQRVTESLNNGTIPGIGLDKSSGKKTPITEEKTGMDELKVLNEKVTTLEHDVEECSEAHKEATEVIDKKSALILALKEKILELKEEKKALISERSVLRATIKKQDKEISETLETVVDLKNYALGLEEVVEDLRDYTLQLEDVSEDLREYALRAEDVIAGLRDYAVEVETVAEDLRQFGANSNSLLELTRSYAQSKTAEVDKSVDIIEGLVEHTRAAHGLIGTLRGSLNSSLELSETNRETLKSAMEIIEAIRHRDTTTPITVTDSKIHNSVGFHLRKNPELKLFENDLKRCKTVKEVEVRVSQLLETLDKAKDASKLQIITESKGEKKIYDVKGMNTLKGWR